MGNPAVKNGILMGVASIVVTMLLYFVDKRSMISYGSWIGYVIIAYFMYAAAAGTKSANGGNLTFGEGLVSSMTALAIGMLISSIFAYLLYNVIDPSLLDTMKEIQVEMIDKMAGFMGEDAAEQAKDAMEDNPPSFGIGTVAIGYVVSLIFPGLVIALIVSAVTKKNPDNFA